MVRLKVAVAVAVAAGVLAGGIALPPAASADAAQVAYAWGDNSLGQAGTGSLGGQVLGRYPSAERRPTWRNWPAAKGLQRDPPAG